MLIHFKYGFKRKIRKVQTHCDQNISNVAINRGQIFIRIEAPNDCRFVLMAQVSSIHVIVMNVR